MTDYKAEYEKAVRVLKGIKGEYDIDDWEYACLWGTEIFINGCTVQDIDEIITEHDEGDDDNGALCQAEHGECTG